MRRPSTLVSACVLALSASSAVAMVTVPAGFDQMLAQSQLVVHGRIVAAVPYETAGRRTIETRVEVEVIETLKGAPGDQVFFRIPGGQVGRYRRLMVGAPVFRPGEEVVLFLRGQMPAMPMPFGLSQGVYRVSRGADGRAFVSPPVTAAEGRVTRGAPERRAAELPAFVAHVRSLAGSGR